VNVLLQKTPSFKIFFDKKLQILAEKRIVEKLKIKRFFNAVGMEENKDDNNWQSQLFLTRR
jgi:hypothetical protein